LSALQQLDDEPKLVVALATHGGRVQSHVRAFLSGPGREQFVISDAGRAQVLIADYDNELSRAELHHFMLMGQGPAIVLALADPGLPGTVWVPKPLQDDALLYASQLVWSRLAQRAVVPPLALTPAAAPPASTTARPTLRLLPSTSDVPKRTTAAPASPLPLPPSRERLGPFSIAPRDDWTARILWIAVGILGIAAAVTSLGWRPAEPTFRPVTDREAAAQPLAFPTPALQQAVSLSLRAIPPMSGAQRNAIEVDLSDYRRLATLQPETLTFAKLTLGSDAPDVSRRALPVELMPDAASLWPGQAEVRVALAAATRNASVVAKRDD
jgi:hypothetical protein